MKIKALLCVIFALAIFAAGCAFTPKGEGIGFTDKSWKEVLAKAKAEHKPIFVDISASWCGPCQMLKKRTFTDKDVAEYYNANFVNAEYDGEKGDGVMLAEKFSMTAYPSLFILDTNGAVLYTTVGYQTAGQLLEFGKQIRNEK